MKLQLLQTEGHLLERILRRVHSPDLVWLSWRDCPYSNLPSWIPVNNLRVLKVEGKVLKTLWQDRSQVPFQLRELEISGKVSKISKSVGQLKHLERIFFRYGSFQKLPKEFCNMKLLKVLALEKCSKLKALPDSFGNLTNLQSMELSFLGSLKRLPESLGNLTNLQSMNMKLNYCRSLERLPSIKTLLSLEELRASDCVKLKSIPDLAHLTKLRLLNVKGCHALEELDGC
jgi:Leucine-rich repeat (LRR) protein